MSYIKQILENNYSEVSATIQAKLNAKCAIVLENCDKTQIVKESREADGVMPSAARPADQVVVGDVADPSGLAASGEGMPDENEEKTDMPVAATGVVTEMRDLPDNSAYPLTRREVEKLLASYERRSDAEDSNIDDIEARSEDGMRRARWYPPEAKSDYVPDPADDMFGKDMRPAKLMPYDYKYTVSNNADDKTVNAWEVEDSDGDKEDDDRKKQNFSGERNLYFGGANNSDMGETGE